MRRLTDRLSRVPSVRDSAREPGRHRWWIVRLWLLIAAFALLAVGLVAAISIPLCEGECDGWEYDETTERLVVWIPTILIALLSIEFIVSAARRAMTRRNGDEPSLDP